MPPPPTSTVEKKSGPPRSSISAPIPDAGNLTPGKRALPPPPSSSPAVVSPQQRQIMRLRSGRTTRQAVKVVPPSPISQRILARKQELKELAEENLTREQAENIKRKLLVTEQVTIICPHLNMTYVLNRRADKFVGHFKADQKPPAQAKRDRKHWDVPAPFRSKWRKSANQEGNNPLHLAVIEQKIDLVRAFIKTNLSNEENASGELPLHLSVKINHVETFQLLLDNTENVNKQNVIGDTPLHRACAAGKHQYAKLLLERGAVLDIENKKGQTPRSIIEQSDNDELKKLLVLQNKSSYTK